MAIEPRTCDICGALITDGRGGELITFAGGAERVWVHPSCRTDYEPTADARWAFLAIADDPLEVDYNGWVPMRAIETQRGLWNSDNADFEAGLAELVKEGWVESKSDALAFRLTSAGASQCGRFGLG